MTFFQRCLKYFFSAERAFIPLVVMPKFPVGEVSNVPCVAADPGALTPYDLEGLTLSMPEAYWGSFL